MACTRMRIHPSRKRRARVSQRRSVTTLTMSSFEEQDTPAFHLFPLCSALLKENKRVYRSAHFSHLSITA